MSTIQAAAAKFDTSINQYAEEKRKSAQVYRRSDYGRAESRAIGAIGMGVTLVSSIAIALNSGALMQATPGDVANAFMVAPVVAGFLTYAASQAAPFRQEIGEKLKGMSGIVPAIGSGICKAFAGFGQALSSLGDKLNMSDNARALRNDAKYIKQLMGVDSMKAVKGTADWVYGSNRAQSVVHKATWLREGIDQAVKDKLSGGDKTPLSYNDIETGILKRMDKANVLGQSVEESRGKINVMESVRLMLGNPSSGNMDLPKGDFSSLKDDRVLNKLHARDKFKDGGENAPS